MVTIAILGMHRSGTSCLAGSLQQAGLYLGEVVEQAPHNRKGNRESLAIRSLNDRLLESNDGAWNRPPAELVWSEIFASTRDRLIAKFADRTSWGFKDPRTLLTLPFWQDGIPELVFVGTFRHPVAVAKSLLARDGIAPNDAFSLWTQYNARLLCLAEAHGFPLISFDSKAETYHAALIEICVSLGLDPGRRGGKVRFFEKSLRHEDDKGGPRICGDAMDIYRRLQTVTDASRGLT